MKRLFTNLTAIPFLLRVVSLYVVVGAGIYVAVVATPPLEPTVAYIPPRPVSKPVVQVISGEPASVSVPKLGVDLPVIEGTYERSTDSWTLTDDKAQFAAMTDRPNDQSGNTFIYGHNTDRVFAGLSGLAAGDVALVKTTNGRTFSYTYTGQKFVQPDNTAVLNERPTTSRLTLMTCEGLFSQTRRIMYFDFKEVI